ncbi:ubiquitin carboxyl-terminal hydrolase 2 [Galendromus occidentalis]|uniref:Ubiquitin carboxyl-terminal hydrolase n=1 Tax=Galendromus occidentalis TaxID=34638 RepID=A0AAJ6QXT0_9ACAR|nr:ubiquitin carboxyl-terminal hydrolase 2 [Galendromus occidentalis]
MSLLSTPGSSWSLPSSRHYTTLSSSTSLATLRSKPPRSSTLAPSTYFSSSTSIDLPSRRSRMFLGREDALERSEPVKLTSYRDLSESRLALSRADSLSRGIRRLSITDLSTLTSSASGLDINGNVKKGHERSLSGCSQISGEALAPSPTGSDSGLGSRSITPSSSYHYRTLGSSNSSVDSIEVAVKPLTRHRIRRVSTASGDSSSGISVSSRSSARSLGSAADHNGNSTVAVVGLRNLGNSCFMNSIIQCLVHTQLADYFRGRAFRADVNTSSLMKGDLAQAFASLVTSMWTSKDGSAISPTEFRSQIQKYAPRFMGYSQQDAQEFLRYLLQGLHEDVNRVRIQPRGTCLPEIDGSLSDHQKAAESWRRYLRVDDSRIVDLFVGQLKSTLKCSECGHKSVTFDPFWDLSLPISDSRCTASTLQQCLEYFTKEEVLDGDEKPTCDQCKKRQRMTKNLSIWKCPKILVLHLKRFGNSERYRSKLETNVQFPLRNLDISAFMSNGGDSHFCKYNLIGVSNHSGSTHSGHYTATCLNPINRQWYSCNDARVSEVGESRVVSSEAYVLFYELDGTTFSRL